MVLSKRPKKSVIKKRNLISYLSPESNIAEQFRMIQANIHFLIDNQKERTFLVTSPSVGEGKSTIAANLAVSMAQQKKKILLIDANLRTPVQHLIFKIPNQSGLTDVLTGNDRFEDAVIHTKIGRLDVLTSGTVTVNHAELLGSSTLQELLDQATKMYDLVLIDSFSVINVSDTKLLAKKCEGVVLVIQNGKTTIEKAVEAKKELEFSKTRLIGAILNKN